MQIQQQQNENKGSFYISDNTETIAAMTYSLAPGNIMIIDHTEVADSLRGKNVGYELVEAAAAFARESNLKIIPLCPFAKAVFTKKQEQYRDVLRN